MSKWLSLQKFAGQVSKPKHVKKMICEEVCDMMDAWKNDEFAPDISELSGLNDSEFVKKYEDDFYETAQHEGAEAIRYLIKFFAAHDIDIMQYVNALQKKIDIKMAQHKIAEKATAEVTKPKINVVIPV